MMYSAYNQHMHIYYMMQYIYIYIKSDWPEEMDQGLRAHLVLTENLHSVSSNHVR